MESYAENKNLGKANNIENYLQQKEYLTFNMKNMLKNMSYMLEKTRGRFFIFFLCTATSTYLIF